MKPKRIQRKRTKGWRMPENTVYVGRGSKWGNQYKVSKHLTVAETVSLYKKCIVSCVRRNPGFWNLSELKGKNLACWCPLDKECHADILLEIANE